MRIRCLTVHAPYACAHAGACCRAGWRIPVAQELIAPLRAVGIRIGRGRVAPARPGGECVFFESGAGRLCAIHRRAGPALLPSVCRHFPRVIVNDPRGTSITLSHFCPTAAGLLFERTRLAVVDATASMALDGMLEGLDATSVLPPLLTAGVLTDWEGYSAWEEAAVRLFDREDLEPAHAVAMLGQATERACSWRPGRETMAAAVRHAFADVSEAGATEATRWAGLGPAVNAFLAAHAFASWAAYEPGGLRSVCAAVAVALKTLTARVEASGLLTKATLIEAMRSADLWLRHSAARL